MSTILSLLYMYFNLTSDKKMFQTKDIAVTRKYTDIWMNNWYSYCKMNEHAEHERHENFDLN